MLKKALNDCGSKFVIGPPFETKLKIQKITFPELPRGITRNIKKILNFLQSLV